MSFFSALEDHGISMSEEEELAVQSWIIDPSEELASRISKTTLFGMLEVYHTGIMDAFQSFQRLHLWAYRTAGRLHLEPNSVARQVVLARLDTVLERLGRHQRDIASWNSRSGLVMDALVERRLTYGEKVRLTVEVRRLSENLRGETAVMAELMEVVGTDSSDWRETPVV